MSAARLLAMLVFIGLLGIPHAAYPIDVTGPLRDASGLLLGTVKSRGSSALEIRDCRNRLAGTYDSRTNRTRDAPGTIVGTGYLLPTLIAHCH